MLPLEECVARTISRHSLARSGQALFIALSGGTDSVALLRAMSALGEYRLAALHCNFSLRGAESEADEAFVRQLCLELDLPVQVRRFDTKAYAQAHGLSIEMAARELRYAWFAEVLERHEESVVAVAHHADDQIETMLLNLSMGTGLRGLSGMPYKRHDRIIRPLLDCSRADIEAYLRELNQPSREDSSNREIIYRRNYIRHRLLPCFEALNPSFRSSTIRTIDHLRGAEAIYLAAIEDLKSKVMLHDGMIQITRLFESPHPETLLYEIAREYGFGSEQCHAMMEALSGLKSDARFVSPTHLIMRHGDKLEILPRAWESLEPIPLDLDRSPCGHIDLPLGRLCWGKGAADELEGTSCQATEALFDADLLDGCGLITVRSRREGDILAPFGMKGRKKLRRIFIDNKFSHAERRSALLLCADDRPIWLIGHLADRTYSMTPHTQTYIRFWLEPNQASSPF